MIAANLTAMRPYMGIGSLLQEHGDKIGKTAYWLADKQAIRVLVTIHDVKDAFGHLRFLISPVQGSGEKWIDAKYVEFDGDGKAS